MTDASPPPKGLEAQPLLEVRKLVVGHEGRSILPPLRFAIRPGELWALLGRNGGGKTTLLRTLMGLLPRIAGELSWSNGVVKSYVPQRASVDPLVPGRVIDLVRSGVDAGWSFASPTFGRAGEIRVRSAIADTHLETLETTAFRELSEGQKQRVLLARALVVNPRLLVLDEPTSAMDFVAEQAVFALLDELRSKRDLAVLVVSHQLPPLRARASHAILVDKDARLAMVGTCEEIVRAPEFVARYGVLARPPTATSATAMD